MSWFSHSSAIAVFAPPGSSRCEDVLTDQQVRMSKDLIENPEGLSRNGHLDCT